MTNTEGMKNKFVVIKREDLQRYTNAAATGVMIDWLAELIDKGRLASGKTPASNNRYLVINTDEPYADEIIEIMKRYGHWGEQV